MHNSVRQSYQSDLNCIHKVHCARCQATVVSPPSKTHGFSLSPSAQHGCTPLHCAAWNGHAKVAKALLEKGAAIEAQEDTARSGCHTHHNKFAPALLQSGVGDVICAAHALLV